MKSSAKKTVLVIYTDRKLNAKEAARMKRYAFNTSSKIKVGDMLKSPEYNTPMQVVKVLDKGHKYYNASTGEISDAFNSTLQWEIRDLILRNESETAVHATLITQ